MLCANHRDTCGPSLTYLAIASRVAKIASAQPTFLWYALIYVGDLRKMYSNMRNSKTLAITEITVCVQWIFAIALVDWCDIVNFNYCNLGYFWAMQNSTKFQMLPIWSTGFPKFEFENSILYSKSVLSSIWEWFLIEVIHHITKLYQQLYVLTNSLKWSNQTHSW